MAERVVIVCGGREWAPAGAVAEAAEAWLVLWLLRLQATMVLHGDQRGADRWAARVIARRLRATTSMLDQGVVVVPVAADWDRFGDPAGPIRNREMLARAYRMGGGFVMGCLAFPGGPGTKDMCDSATRLGVEVLRFSP